MFDITVPPAQMLKLPQVPCPVYHHFGEGIYIREVHIPAGTMAIGHKQKTRHNNILLKGSLLIVNDKGDVVKLEAPMFFVGEPGQKKGFILEDTVWQNIYSTTETDVDKLEEMFIEKEESYLEHSKMTFLIEQAEAEIDRVDYNLLLQELSLTEEQVQEDMAARPYEQEFNHATLRIAPSPIHGVGVFTTAPIYTGAVIGTAHTSYGRTPLGRYVNHKIDPNCEYVLVGDSVLLIAKEDIDGCLGGSLGTELSVNYRQAISLPKQIKE